MCPRRKRKHPKRNKRKSRKGVRLAHGSCLVCGRNTGGFSGVVAWRCKRCQKLFCVDCCPVGSKLEKLVCPDCGTEFHSVE